MRPPGKHVVQLSETGACLMHAALPDVQPGGLGVDAAGNIYVAGTFTTTADFGTGPLPAPGPYPEVFLLELTPQGNVAWVGTIHGNFQYPHLTVGPSGDATLYGGSWTRSPSMASGRRR